MQRAPTSAACRIRSGYFSGLSLLHRYKNSRAGSRLEPLFALLTPAEITEAEILGKAMRFGAMLSAQSPEKTGTLDLSSGPPGH